MEFQNLTLNWTLANQKWNSKLGSGEEWNSKIGPWQTGIPKFDPGQKWNSKFGHRPKMEFQN